MYVCVYIYIYMYICIICVYIGLPYIPPPSGRPRSRGRGLSPTANSIIIITIIIHISNHTTTTTTTTNNNNSNVFRRCISRTTSTQRYTLQWFTSAYYDLRWYSIPETQRGTLPGDGRKFDGDLRLICHREAPAGDSPGRRRQIQQ